MADTNRRVQRRSKPVRDIHVDEKFLQDHLKDVRAEMSWRRELEFRLMQFLLVFYPILGTAMITLFESNVSKQAFYVTTAGAILLILVATIFVTDRINREHNSYAELGRQVQKIWAYFGLFEPGAYLKNDTVVASRLLDAKSGYGQGQGHKKTLGLIRLVTAALLLILLALAWLKT